MRAFLEARDIPAGAAFRRQDALDNDSPSYVGDVGIGINPKLAARVREADLLLVVGPRLGEMTTSGYTLVESPTPAQTLVHVHPGAEELGRVYRPALPILSGMEQFADAVRDAARRASLARVGRRGASRLRGVAAARADARVARSRRVHRAPPRARCPTRSSTNGAGNFSVWVHRFWRWHDYPTQLAPTSGAMGYGVPAAVAAKAVRPERTVICFAGDGDFLMSGQELATAVQYDLPIVVLVVNNGMYGTIRMHQERQFPGRVVGHRPGQPGLRCVCPRVRRPRRDGRRDERVRRRARARARVREAGAPRAPDRSRGDHAADDAERDSRGRVVSGREEYRVPGRPEPISH